LLYFNAVLSRHYARRSIIRGSEVVLITALTTAVTPAKPVAATRLTGPAFETATKLSTKVPPNVWLETDAVIPPSTQAGEPVFRAAPGGRILKLIPVLPEAELIMPPIGAVTRYVAPVTQVKEPVELTIGV
jgi:hypothetical protein